MKRTALFLFASAFLLSACGEKLDPVQTQTCDPAQAVNYTDDLAPLFARYCTGCHSANAANRNGAPIGVDFDSYGAAAASAESANIRVQAGSMPPPQVSLRPDAADRCLLQAWVDLGSPEN
jgi:mono/diheme cytochrome c family protein